MSTLTEVQTAAEKLSPRDRAALSAWLSSKDEPILSAREEAALLVALDNTARELDAGRGVPLEAVRESVAKWAAK